MNLWFTKPTVPINWDCIHFGIIDLDTGHTHELRISATELRLHATPTKFAKLFRVKMDESAAVLVSEERFRKTTVGRSK